ncbi:MAG: hypothetical protein KJO21_10100 [Verrucomicrobiae bacterium]|nr:hypothetical protein [Verrucomicrobiae bacterium]NNJ43812.1 hypothetical protein [Akkermansiaceae bacterium]
MIQMQEPISRVYTDAHVYRRFLEFLGGETLDEATAVYVTHADGCRIQAGCMEPVDRLPVLMDNDWDMDRSLLDRKSLLAHLDIEYVNFDSPAECYLNPVRSFALQQPVIDVIEQELLECGIRPLHLLTGQGHHFVWRIDQNSDALAQLTALMPKNTPEGSPIPFSSLRLHEYSQKWEPPFYGLCLVMEYLAHLIKRFAAPESKVPVEMTAVNVGGGGRSREMISVDISEYGDPLWTRVIRMPFTHYLKPWKSGLAAALGIAESIPPIFTIPMHEVDMPTALRMRNSADQTKELAHRACVRIPEQSEGMSRLISRYMDSPLRRFHQKYDEIPMTTDLDMSWVTEYLPPCAAYIVANPNDLLLKPSGMKLVVRCLLALGGRPRQIAAMIAGVFKDARYDWSGVWNVYSPEMRADFYTRLFVGQIATGLDESVDFNCVSTQEQGFCFNAQGCNLKPWRKRLAATKKDTLL